MQRQYPQHGRALALEAGEAMHQFFAAMRVWQLHKFQGLKDHAKVTGERIFGEPRWHEAWKNAMKQKNDMDQVGQLAVDILNTSGYYDDPNDKIRTLSNMQTAAVVYARESYPYLYAWPIWVADAKSPLKPVGIEQVFDCILEYTDGKRIRFIGTLDGILCNTSRDNRITMADNKTASRMDRGWIEAHKIRHQFTGYMACGMAVFGFEMWHARVYGCRLKPMYRGEDVHVEPISRTREDIDHWANWVRRQVEIFEEYQIDWEHAERRTHSCNRYFRPCSLIPFCADSAKGRQEQWDQMIDTIPSPSERAIEA
jgi:PD-(D/E)XK nuclease superfamily